MSVQIIGPSGYIANVDANNNLYVTLANSDIAGLPIVGGLTHNAAAPAAASQLGVLPAVASSGAPTYNAGDQVLLSTDLSGNLRALISFPATPIIYLEGHAGGVMDAVQGATAAASNLSVAGTFNTSLPTIGNGDQSAIQLDAKGQQLIDFNYVLGALHSVTNPVFALPSDGTNGMGVMTNFGSTPGAVKALNANASLFIGTVVAVAASAGVQKVGISGNAGASLDQANGSAVPTNGVMVGGGSVAGGTNFTTLTVKAASTAAVASDTSLVTQSFILGHAAATLDQANGSAVPTNGLLVGGGSVAGGTNFSTLTVKAASTAAAATDTALVVQALVNSHTMVTAAAGVQQVGVVGNAAAAFDQAPGSAVPANGLMVGGGSVAGGTTFEAITVKAASTAAAAGDTSVVIQLSPSQPNLTTPLNTTCQPTTTGGCSTSVQQALTTTINIKASAGQMYGYTISNPNNTVAYVEYYNTATTPGTIGSTTNLIMELMIPGGATANMEWSNGIPCSSGIAVAVATTATGNAAPGIGLTITTLYK